MTRSQGKSTPSVAGALTESGARAVLGRATGPVWIVAPSAASILAANAAGSALLGPAGTILDAAMPGLARLRALPPGGSATSPHLLVLWTRRGVRKLQCTAQPVAWPGGRPALPLAALLVAAVDETRRPMDDAATLREIARRIREGSQALAGAGEKPVTPASNAARLPLEHELEREPDARPTARPDVLSGSKPQLPPDLIAELAHELKTPLSAIAAAAEIMKDERLGEIGNERYRGYASDIHDGARHALAVIERLLERCSPDAQGRTAQMKLAPVDLNALARSCLASIEPIAAAKGIATIGDTALHSIIVRADSTSLRQILLNLLTNAVKFCRAGDEVKLVTRAGAAGTMTIEVHDTGPGMTEQETASAFDASRTRTPVQREGGGIGLGLPLVRALVAANGAEMSLRSAPSKGTSVTITFPRGQAGPGTKSPA